MKKLILLLLICGCLVIGQPVVESDDPVETKPVLVKDAWQWNGAWYQKVIMPDGSKQELKSRTQLDSKGWQALAEKVYIKPQPPPEECSHCGGTGIEP